MSKRKPHGGRGGGSLTDRALANLSGPDERAGRVAVIDDDEDSDAAPVGAALDSLARHDDDDLEVARPIDGELYDDDSDSDVPDDLRFTTSKKKTENAENDVLEIEIDGENFYAHRPAKGAWSLIIGSLAAAATDADKTAAMLEFVFAAFDSTSQIVIKNRLLSRSDEFDIEDLSDICSSLIRKWAGTPTRAQRRAAAARRR